MKSLITALALAALTFNADAAEPAKAPALAPSATTAPLPAGHPPMPNAAPGATPGAKAPTGHPTAAPADMSKATAPLNRKAKVVSVLDAKQFTYMEVQDGAKKLWLVSPALAIKKGDTVAYADSDLVPKFHSSTLNRDFTNVVLTTHAVVDKK